MRLHLEPPLQGLSIIQHNHRKYADIALVARYEGLDQPCHRLETRIEMRVQSSPARATFRVVLSALPPVVHHVRGDGVRSNVEVGVLSFVVSRAGGVRRLILETGGGGLRIEEVEYVQEAGFGVVSFEIPAVGREIVGEIGWALEVVARGRVWRANDESGFRLQFGWRPVLKRVVPGVVQFRSTGFLSLQGEFVTKNVKGVRIGATKVLVEDLLSVTEAEIGIRLPRLRRREGMLKLEVAVMDQSGLDSKGMVVVFDSMALKVEATVLESSYDAEKGRILVPLFCGVRTVPTIAVRVKGNGGLASIPVYSFAVRTSDMVAGEFRQMYSGENSMVSLDKEGLFSEDKKLERQVITVWVSVTAAARVGETVLFISRQLRRDQVGVTVSSSKSRALAHYPRTMLESSVGQIEHCNGAEDLKIKTKWTINGDEVLAQKSESSTNDGEGQGILMGLGDRVLLPELRTVMYEFSVTVSNKSSGDLFASGLASGILQDMKEEWPLWPVVNGGVRSAFVSVETNFLLTCEVSNKVDVAEAATMRYVWTCRDTSAEDGVCPEILYPTRLKGRATNISHFTIPAHAGEEGKVLEYTVQVKSAIRESEIVSFNMTFVGNEKISFPDARLETRAGIVPTVATPKGSGLTFDTFDHIVLSIDGTVSSSALDFALVQRTKQGSLIELLDGEWSNLLINHNGYWSREVPFAAFFGFRAGGLPPGNYTLHGAVGDTAGPDVGTAWVFNVAMPPLVVLSEPTTQFGIVNYTTFHVSAISIPSSENQFYFSLRLFTDDIPTISNRSYKSFARPSNCLGSCNGYGTASFVVTTSGRFVVVVDMYDPTGTRFITSKTGQSYIVVQNPASLVNSITHLEKTSPSIEAVLDQGDEKTFLATLLKLPPKHSFHQMLFADALRGLQAISSSPFCNPLRMSFVLDACTNVISLEEVQDLNAFNLILTIVANCIAQTPPSAPFGSVIVPRLTHFYSAAADKLELIVRRNNGRNDGKEALATVASFLDLRAFQDIALVLSAGLECGATARALVARNTTHQKLDRQIDAYAVLQDDYRVGISCFEGQIRSLPPEPALSQMCPSSPQSQDRKRYETTILISVERHDSITSSDAPREIIKGPTVRTNLLRWNDKLERPVLIESARAASEKLCLRSRASVFTVHGVTQVSSNPLNKQRRVECRNSGRILILEACSNCTKGAAEIKGVQRVDELEVGADGRVSAAVEMRAPGHFRLEVNRTLVNICMQDTSVEGEWDGGVNVIGCLAAGLSAVGVMFMVAGVVACMKRGGEKQEAYSVPSEAGYDDFLTESGEGAGQRCDWMFGEKFESWVGDKWGEEYVRMSSVESRVGEEGEDEDAAEEEGESWVGRALGGVRRLSLSECEWEEEMVWYGGGDAVAGSLASESVECFVVDNYGRADYEKS